MFWGPQNVFWSNFKLRYLINYYNANPTNNVKATYNIIIFFKMFEIVIQCLEKNLRSQEVGMFSAIFSENIIFAVCLQGAYHGSLYNIFVYHKSNV